MKHDICKPRKKPNIVKLLLIIFASIIFIPIFLVSMPLWIFILISIAILASILGVIIFIFG